MKCKQLLFAACCFIFVLLGCLCIGVGCWLETNSLFYTSYNRYFSFLKFNAYPVNNVNEQIIVVLGLWRFCLNNMSTGATSCSPVQLNFDIDLVSLFHNNDNLLYTTTATYSRCIPLILTTLLAVISFGTSISLLHYNKKKSLQRRAVFFVISIESLLCSILVSISFGITYRHYISSIRSACSLSTTSYICTDYELNTEAILLGLSIGLFVVNSVICSFFSLKKRTEQHPDPGLSSSSAFESPFEATACPEVINEKPITNHHEDETSLQRASLRPPPPNFKARLSANDEDQRESILIPPILPFANYSQTNRPPSYGSNHTFGFTNNNGRGSSPVTDDASSQVSCYVKHDRNYSNTSNQVYMTSQNVSDHTLGGSMHLQQQNRQLHNSHYANFNASRSDSSQYTNSVCSFHQQDDLLQQRINSYLNPNN